MKKIETETGATTSEITVKESGTTTLVVKSRLRAGVAGAGPRPRSFSGQICN